MLNITEAFASYDDEIKLDPQNNNLCVFVWTPDQNDSIYWNNGANSFFGFNIKTLVSSQTQYQNFLSGQKLYERIMWSENATEHDTFQSNYTIYFPDDGVERSFHETLICKNCTTNNTKRIYGVIHELSYSTDTKKHVSMNNSPSISLMEKEKCYVTGTRLKEHLAQTVAYATRYQMPAGYLLFKVTNINEIKKTYGHIAYKKVMLNVGNILSSQLRDADITGQLEDSQFGIILTRIEASDLRATAYRLIDSIKDMKILGIDCPVEINASGTVIVKAETTVSELEVATQQALQHSIQLGRYEYLSCMPEIYASQEAEDQNKLIIETVSHKNIQLALQPVVKANEHTSIKFYECLARIVDKDHNIIPAYKFIPFIEEMGFMHLLDRQVLGKVFEILTKKSDISLSMNLTPSSINDTEWIEKFTELAKNHPNAATRLIIEMTETLAITDFQKMANFLKKIRETGVKVAIDDFGVGFTSFQYFRDLPVDIVKIDGSYIRDISSNPANQILVKTITSLAKNFNIQIVAEFVDSLEDAKLLNSYGVDYFQGYFFGKPEIKNFS